jgi:murein DD-endopeptidase MepM/ murein hydrolase activator NlpD
VTIESPRFRAAFVLAPVFATALLVGVACDDRLIPTAPPPVQVCGGYLPPEGADSVLPYPVGASYVVIQSNCTGLSHHGDLRYAYDFGMPIGTTVTAMQSGVVVIVEEGFPDGDRSTIGGNSVVIEQADGTFAAYVHLTQEGALVEVGDFVSTGQPVGLSGNSGGASTDPPHLHVETVRCNADFSRCVTVPISFRNASPESAGPLETGVAYTATGF